MEETIAKFPLFVIGNKSLGAIRETLRLFAILISIFEENAIPLDFKYFQIKLKSDRKTVVPALLSLNIKLFKSLLIDTWFILFQ